MKGKPTVENRRFKRYRVKEGVYAVLRDNGTRKMGTMLDISRGGLSYQYVPENSTENGTFQLDIFMAGEGFHRPGDRPEYPLQQHPRETKRR
ncbi:MAG: PilZ domain-containing protein [Deltaproteobacteria bacterium]|nr:PilZ domain-containing protein [Deltaproteobacteria bacterium]